MNSSIQYEEEQQGNDENNLDHEDQEQELIRKQNEEEKKKRDQYLSKDMLIFGLTPPQYFSNKDPNLVNNPRK